MAKKKSTKAAGTGKKAATAKSVSKAKPKAKVKSAAKSKVKTKPAGKATKMTNTKSAKKPVKKAVPKAAKPPAKKPVKKLAKQTSAKAVKPAVKAKVTKPASPNSKTKTTSLKISKPPATAIAHHAVEPPEPPTAAELRKADSGLTKGEKEAYRKMLLEKRSEILGDVETLKSAALSTGGNLSNMPLHMADVGSDQYEQEAMLGLVESERRLLREINDALVRLQDGTYGVCVDSGKPIGKARLDITPWAKYTIEVVREKERLGQR